MPIMLGRTVSGLSRDLSSRTVRLLSRRRCGPHRKFTTTALDPTFASELAKAKTYFLSRSWSGRWESNPRHTAWEAVVLPLNYARGPFAILTLLAPVRHPKRGHRNRKAASATSREIP